VKDDGRAIETIYNGTAKLFDGTAEHTNAMLQIIIEGMVI
jgi:hypothetical protein